jgi:ABC-type phosphate/phosphonate transport system substrate-binding protein
MKHLWQLAIWAMLLLATVPATLAGEPESALTFVGVALDAETQKADERLREFLRSKLALKFETRDMEYGAAVDTLVHWNVETKGPLMARVTPYVYVVAEMLGAELEILATYVSKRSKEATYSSYFVVHKASGLQSDDLDEFVKYLRNRSTPARFVYHNKFSTSSYLLPSLYFRRTGIFSTNGPNAADKKRIFIRAEKPPGIDGSTDLVRMVKQRKADFAAVWEGTQSRFANDPDLIFLKLPNTLPNDLLVFTPMQDRGLRNRVQASLKDMKNTDIGVGDFLRWQDINTTPEARRALASLRWLARVRTSPVPIKIRKAHNDTTELDLMLVEAAKQAVRLSGTEFVLFDEDFHKHFDVLWTLRKTHEDSLTITSEFPDFNLPPQTFHISFKRGDRESLVARIEDQISDNMHRVRDIWPFDDEVPTVLRDVKFNLAGGSELKAMKITWNDLTDNDRVVGAPFRATVAASNFHFFKLKGDGFPKLSDGTHYDFDPLSNTAHRVILMRPVVETRVFRIGTYALAALFSLAAGFALWSLFRAPRETVAGGT